MQLEELANEQEQQSVEHQRITAALNDKIERWVEVLVNGIFIYSVMRLCIGNLLLQLHLDFVTCFVTVAIVTIGKEEKFSLSHFVNLLNTDWNLKTVNQF